MWFRKKKVEEFESKYQVGDFVRFRFNGPLSTGYIYARRKTSDGLILYDVQLGGECPSIIENVKEEDIPVLIKKK
ncbi:MAG: hypothetical protein K6F32_06870 [Bacilli bacterium]|nr:hypothetical protein [Bacilli bacterium]